MTNNRNENKSTVLLLNGSAMTPIDEILYMQLFVARLCVGGDFL